MFSKITFLRCLKMCLYQVQCNGLMMYSIQTVTIQMYPAIIACHGWDLLRLRIDQDDWPLVVELLFGVLLQRQELGAWPQLANIVETIFHEVCATCRNISLFKDKDSLENRLLITFFQYLDLCRFRLQISFPVFLSNSHIKLQANPFLHNYQMNTYLNWEIRLLIEVQQKRRSVAKFINSLHIIFFPLLVSFKNCQNSFCPSKIVADL